MAIEKIKFHIKDRKKQDFVIYGLGQAFNLISPLLVAPYIVAVCGEEGFGKVGFSFSLMLFLILVVDYAFEIRGTKEISENRENAEIINSQLNLTVFAKIFLFVLTFLVMLVLVKFAPFAQREKTLLLYSMMIVFAQVFNPAWFLQGVENFRAASMLNIGSKVLYVVLVYRLVVEASDYVFVNLFLGCSALLFNLAGLAYVSAKYNIKYSVPRLMDITAILKADFSVCLSQLFLSIRQQFPVFVITYMLGYYAAGQYRILEQVTSPYRTFMQVLMRFFYPSLCFKISSDPPAGIAYWKRYSMLNLAGVILSVGVLFFLSEEILAFFNASQDTIEEMNGVFRLVLIVPVLFALTLPLEQLMFATDRNKAYVRISIAVTVISIIFTLLAIKTYGILGIIVSLVLAELLLIILYGKYSLFSLKDKA